MTLFWIGLLSLATLIFLQAPASRALARKETK